MRHGDEPHHLIGSTLHNIGVLQLWQRQYKEAWENFNQAATIRMQSLSKNHPDIAVRTLSVLRTLSMSTSNQNLTISLLFGL
jgi:hypothetical protein